MGNAAFARKYFAGSCPSSHRSDGANPGAQSGSDPIGSRSRAQRDVRSPSGGRMDPRRVQGAIPFHRVYQSIDILTELT